MKSRTAETVLAECYLETRAKVLEVAAILDRIDRAGDTAGGVEMSGDASMRHDQLIRAIRLLLSDSPRRAQEIQQLFSRTYDPQWRSTFGLPGEPVSDSPANAETVASEKPASEKPATEKPATPQPATESTQG